LKDLLFEDSFFFSQSNLKLIRWALQKKRVELKSLTMNIEFPPLLFLQSDRKKKKDALEFACSFSKLIRLEALCVSVSREELFDILRQLKHLKHLEMYVYSNAFQKAGVSNIENFHPSY
jgi:hypothetical protein